MNGTLASGADADVAVGERTAVLAEARSAFAARDFASAAVLLREWVRLNPDDVEAMNDFGVVCHAKGAVYEAEAVLSRAFELDPNSASVQRNLALVAFDLGMFERTSDLCRRAKSLDGSNELDRLVDDAERESGKLRLYPRFVSIETASVCNARCHFCSTPEVERRPFMDEGVWKKIVDDNRDAGVEFRLNMDGEPTLHKQLAEIVAYIKSTTNCTVTFNTNVERLEPALSERLLDAGLDGVRFSIDGFRKETFERHRIGLSYEKVVANALRFLELRERRGHPCFVEVRLIRFPDNEPERQAYEMFWSSFPRVKVVFTTPYYWPSLGNGSIKAPCVRGEDDFEIYYYTDGRATICCMDWQEKAVLGDSRKYSTREIWNSKLALEWRAALRRGDRALIPVCADCNQDLTKDAVLEIEPGSS